MHECVCMHVPPGQSLWGGEAASGVRYGEDENHGALK